MHGERTKRQLLRAAALLSLWMMCQASPLSATREAIPLPAAVKVETPTAPASSSSLAPEVPSSPIPPNGATGVLLATVDPPSHVHLQAYVADSDTNTLTVKFYGRLKCSAPNFALVALPDTQNYSAGYGGGTLAMFQAQTQWVADNKILRNIVFTTHLGDIVDDYASTPQWINANEALSRLENGQATFGLTVGNHDGGPDQTANFNSFFPFTRFAGGGHYGTDNDNSYALFGGGGLDFIIVHLEYDALSTASPVLDWADDLLANQYFDRRAIIVYHNLISGSTAPFVLSSSGTAIYSRLKHNSNLFLMLGGHDDSAEVNLTFSDSGHTVYALRSDYQNRTGGNGWLRIMEFQPASNIIQVRTYSPYLVQWESDSDSEFALAYDMTGSGCASFQLVQTLTGVASGTSPSIAWPGLSTASVYEWYMTVNDGTHRPTSGPIWTFETGQPYSGALYLPLIKR